MSLAGKRIVNTRALHQAAEFDSLLQNAGAIPLSYPCIAIVPPEDTRALDEALASNFDLLVLTSANTVLMLAERLKALGLSLNGVKAAVVGEATEQSARALLGVEISVIPDDYSAEGLADALTVTEGMRVLLPQSMIAGDDLFSALVIRGADALRVTAYRTIRGCGGVELAPLLKRSEVDAVTFTSASAARFFAERLREEGGEIGEIPLVSIGAQTSQSLRELGLKVSIQAEKHTLGGLIDGLTTLFKEHP
ncbi:MAG: uroporphyrinogen-III synthase [Chloroflexota bacterium]